MEGTPERWTIPNLYRLWNDDNVSETVTESSSTKQLQTCSVPTLPVEHARRLSKCWNSLASVFSGSHGTESTAGVDEEPGIEMTELSPIQPALPSSSLDNEPGSPSANLHLATVCTSQATVCTSY